MTQPNARPAPLLKVLEPEINSAEPWSDDELHREATAERLTEVVSEQEAPFVISLDGRWGTGKTFLLKRWRQDLENQGWQSLYYNAWKDDFTDDPLLAIIGQLSEHFDDGTFQAIIHGVANAALAILTKELTGTAIKLDDLKAETWLSHYQAQQREKNRVREELGRLAAKVREETGQPLVFIIDELDRCRPTFAIELLERVKHIFDVPNIVFVFGINRGELVKSLESVYGKIDAGTYLRRFFDLDFSLTEADAVSFCEYLVNRYGLNKHWYWRGEFEDRIGIDLEVASVLPILLGNMGLSLRDMDHCVRLVSLAIISNKTRATVDPGLLAALVAVKLCNPELYHRFTEKIDRGADVINYINDRIRKNQNPRISYRLHDNNELDRIEVAIYCADDHRPVLEQILGMIEDVAPDRPEFLSLEHQRLTSQDAERLREIVSLMKDYTRRNLRFGIDLSRATTLINLYG